MNNTPYELPDGNRPCQGAIYRGITITLTMSANPVELKQWDLLYAVILSQECDLLQDHEHRQTEKEQPKNKTNVDKLLPTVLICPGYPAADFREGKHLEALGISIERKSSDQYKLVKMNRDPRYHFLAAWPQLQVAEMVVDFKHFFTIETELLRDKYGTPDYYIARLTCPYREHLSHRFTSYLGRIGLPLDHHCIGSESKSET